MPKRKLQKSLSLRRCCRLKLRKDEEIPEVKKKK